MAEISAGKPIIRGYAVSEETGRMMDGFKLYDDDGTEINANVVPKPPLCSMCANDTDPGQEMFCTMNRLDQQDEPEFECDAFRPIQIDGL